MIKMCSCQLKSWQAGAVWRAPCTLTIEYADVWETTGTDEPFPRSAQ